VPAMTMPLSSEPQYVRCVAGCHIPRRQCDSTHEAVTVWKIQLPPMLGNGCPLQAGIAVSIVNHSESVNSKKEHCALAGTDRRGKHKLTRFI